MNRRRSGFTLLELIIVVIIIGILASIALPRYIRIAEKGRMSEAKSVLGAIKSAQLRYAAEHGVYTGNPTSTNDLDITLQTGRYFLVTDPYTVGEVTDENAMVAEVTRTAVDDPTSGSAYAVAITARGEITAAPPGDQYL